YQVFEWLVLRRWIERKTVHVGPFVTVVAGFAGLELYGVGGALIVLLAVSLALAALDELAPPEDDHAAFAAASASAPVAEGGDVAPHREAEDGGVALIRAVQEQDVDHGPAGRLAGLGELVGQAPDLVGRPVLGRAGNGNRSADRHRLLAVVVPHADRVVQRVL